MSEINRVEQKIDMFMAAQQETNKSLAESIEKMSNAISRQDAQQVEINQVTQAVQALSHKHDKFGERMGTLEQTQAVASEFRKDSKQLKFMCFGLLLTIIGYGVKTLLWP